MFNSLEVDQQDDQKPPSFLHLITQDQIHGASKIMQSGVCFHYNNQQKVKGQIMLYEDYIIAQIEGKTYILELQLTITFEANYENLLIDLKDSERQVQMTVIFQEIEYFLDFNNQIKRFLFQTNFQQKYDILELIGSGKTANVFKIKDKNNGAIFAAKHYHNIPSSINKQIKILRELQHPNLIYFHQMFLSKGQVFLVMDYEDGGNLLDKIKEESFLSMKEKINFLLDMLNAFQFLRIKGIVHRDLKPENILYSKKDDCYKISDFGLAIYLNESMNKIVGTPGYIAPESFDSNEQNPYSQYSDIYSLGLIYFQLATKKTYFSGQNSDILLRKNKKAKSLKKKSYSKDHISDLEYEILRMMIRSSPEKRLLSLQILQSEQFRKLIKEYSLGKKSSLSSSTSSNNKSNSRKDSYISEFEEGMNEDRFLRSVKKILKLRSFA